MEGGLIRQGIILDQLPMPPSENEAYPTDFQTGRRFTGKELTDFKHRLQLWSLRRAPMVNKLIDELKWELADHRKCLRVDSYLFFQYSSLFTTPTTKTERPRRKKMDPQNKMKALYDSVAKMLGIDDSRIIPGEVIPVVRTDPQGQFIMVKLSFQMIQTDEDFAGLNSIQHKI